VRNRTDLAFAAEVYSRADAETVCELVSGNLAIFFMGTANLLPCSGVMNRNIAIRIIGLGLVAALIFVGAIAIYDSTGAPPPPVVGKDPG
jgi:hypothetical protein